MSRFTQERSVRFAFSLLIAGALAAAFLAGGFALARARDEVPQLRLGRSAHTATLLESGRILVAGGQRFGQAISATELVDPATGQAAAGPDAPFARSGHTATLLGDGRVLIAGGASAGAALDTAEIYDERDGAFAPAGRLARARTEHVGVLLRDGRVLLAGGDRDGSAELFDGSAFQPVATNMREPRFRASALLLADGRVLIAGGRSASGETLDTAEVYDPATGTFEDAGHMKRPRLSPMLSLLPDGKVQLFGGDEGSTMEIFDRDHFTALTVLQVLSPRIVASTNARFAFASTDPLKLDREMAKAVAATADRDGSAVTHVAARSVAVVTGGRSRRTQDLGSINVLPESSAWVTTDKADYHPGEKVTISGGGFHPGETITLALDRNPQTSDLTTLTAVADDRGRFTNADYVCKETDLNVTFTLAASGAASGRIALTSFTDGPAVTSFTIDAAQHAPYGTATSLTYKVTVNSATGTCAGSTATLSIYTTLTTYGMTAMWSADGTPGSYTFANSTGVTANYVDDGLACKASAWVQITTTGSAGSLTWPLPPTYISTPGTYNLAVKSVGNGGTPVVYSNAAPAAYVTAIVDKLPLTSTFTAYSKVYQRTTAATIKNAVLSGYISEDTDWVTANLASGTRVFVGATGSPANDYNVGTGKSVSWTGMTLSGGVSGNHSTYYTAPSPVTTATCDNTADPLNPGNAATDCRIWQFDLSAGGGLWIATALGSSNNTTAPFTGRQYDGTNVVGSTTIGSNALSGDVLTYTATYTFPDANPTVDANGIPQARQVTVNVTAIGGTPIANYRWAAQQFVAGPNTLSTPQTVTADKLGNLVQRVIQKKIVFPTFASVVKTYDGSTDGRTHITSPGTTNITTRAGGDLAAQVDVDPAVGTITFADPLVGVNKTATWTGIALAGTKAAADYTLEPTLNGSFEFPAQGAGVSSAGPIATSFWVFDGRSGLQANGSTIAPAATAPDGTQTAYTTNDGTATGTFTQSVPFASVGTYTITFKAAKVSCPGSCTATVSVSGGALSFDTGDLPADGSFKTFSSDFTFAAAPTTRSLAFTGTVTSGSYVLIDSVSIAPVAKATTCTINKATVYASFSVQTKVYDATTAATPIAPACVSLTTPVNCAAPTLYGTDVVTVNLSAGTATFVNKNVGTGKAVTWNSMALTGADAGQYTLNSTTATSTGDITAKDLHYWIAAANAKTYDRTTTATVTIGSDKLGADSIGFNTTTFGGAANFSSGGPYVMDPGTWDVLVKVSQVTGTDAGNYTPVPALGTEFSWGSVAQAAPTVQATILPRPISATFTATKTYDGSTAATAATTTPYPFVSGDGKADSDLQTVGATIAYTDRTAATGKTVEWTNPTLTGTKYTLDSAWNPSFEYPSQSLVLNKFTTGPSYANLTFQYRSGIQMNGSTLSNGGQAPATTDGNQTAFILSDGGTPAGTGRFYTSTYLYPGDYAISFKAAQRDCTVAGSPCGASPKMDEGVLVTVGTTFPPATSVLDTRNTDAAGIPPGAFKLYSSTFTISTGGTYYILFSGTAPTNSNSGAFIDAVSIAPTVLRIATGTINKAPAIVTSFTANDKVYDGTTAATIAAAPAPVVKRSDGSDLFTHDPAATPDVVSADPASGTRVFSSKTVGAAKTVTWTSMTLTGTDAGNYVLVPIAPASVPTATSTAAITARTLNYWISGVTDKIYDNLTTATTTIGSDKVPSDSVTFSAPSDFYDDVTTNAATALAGNWLIKANVNSISGTDATNYAFTPAVISVDQASNPVRANVIPRQLTATFAAAARTYDGTTDATLTTTLYTRATGDSLTSQLDLDRSVGTFAFPDKNVGSKTAVWTAPPTGFVLSGTKAANYTLNAFANPSFEIPTVTGTSAKPTGASWTFANSSGGIQTNGSAYSNAGQAPATTDYHQTAYLTSISGTAGSFSQAVTFTSGTYVLSFKAVQRKDGGAQDQGVIVTLDGTTTLIDTTTPNPTGVPVDTYTTYTSAPFTFSTYPFPSHTITFTAAVASSSAMVFIDSVSVTPTILTAYTPASITKRTLTAVNFTSFDKPYDGTKAALTNSPACADLTGCVSGDTLSLPAQTTLATSKAWYYNGASYNASGYRVSWTVANSDLAGADAGNYQFSGSPITFTTPAVAPYYMINKIGAVGAVVTNPNTNSYTGAQQAATVNVYGVTAPATNFNITPIGTQEVPLYGTKALEYSGDGGATWTSVTPKSAGTYKVRVTYTPGTSGSGGYTGANYNTTTIVADNDYVIAKYALTVTVATAPNKVYDGTRNHTTYTLSDNRVAGDDVVISSSGTNAFPSKDVTGSPYTITVSSIAITGGANANDYALQNTTATKGGVSITPFPLTVTVGANNKVYDCNTTATINAAYGTNGNGYIDNRFTGTTSGDTLTFTTNSATFDTKNAGTGKTVTVSYTLGGVDASNYSYTSPITTTANITAATPTVTMTKSVSGAPAPVTTLGTGPFSFTYDGYTHDVQATTSGCDGTLEPASGTMSYAYYGTLLDGTAYASAASPTSAPPKNAGSYTAIATFTSSNTNYNNATASTTIAIGRATPQARLNNGSTLVFSYFDNAPHVYTDHGVAAGTLVIRGVGPDGSIVTAADPQITAVKYAGASDDGCSKSNSAWQDSAYPTTPLAGNYIVAVSTAFTGMNANNYTNLVYSDSCKSTGCSANAKAGIFQIAVSPTVIIGTFKYGIDSKTYGGEDFEATATLAYGPGTTSPNSPVGRPLSWKTYDSDNAAVSPSQYCHIEGTPVYDAVTGATIAMIRIDHATPAGGAQCTVQAYFTGDCEFQAPPADGGPAGATTRSFSIAKALPIVYWTNPDPIDQGVALSGMQLNAVAKFTLRGTVEVVAGTYSYFPAAGTTLAAGPNQPLSVSFTAALNPRIPTFATAPPYNIAPWTPAHDDFITPNAGHATINVNAPPAPVPTDPAAYCGSYHSGNGTTPVAASGTTMKAIVAGAFHGGSVTDMITSSAPSGSPGRLRYFKGNGDVTGSFAAGADVTATTGTWGALVTGNFGGTNGDIAVVDEAAPAKVYVYRNDGTGVFTAAAGTPVTVGGVNGISASTLPRGMTVADMNGDGNADLALTLFDAGSGESGVVVLAGNGAGGFTVQTPHFVPVNYAPYGIGAADFDNDGKMDVVVADNGTDTTVSVLYGNGTGGFSGHSDWSTAGPNPRAIAVGDINGDGHADVVVGGYGISTNTGSLYKLMGSGLGGFTSTADGTKPSGTLASVVRVSWVSLADLDGDGDLDCAAVSYSGNVLSIYLNKGDAKATYIDSANNVRGVRTTATGPVGIAIANLDNESRLDLAVVAGASISRYLLNVAPAAAVDAASQAITSSAAGATVTININLTGTGPYTVKYQTSATGTTTYSASASGSILALKVAPTATTTYTITSVSGAASCSGAIAAAPANRSVVTVP